MFLSVPGSWAGRLRAQRKPFEGLYILQVRQLKFHFEIEFKHPQDTGLKDFFLKNLLE